LTSGWLGLRPDWPWRTVQELQDQGVLLVEDGNHGENRPRPYEFIGDGTAFLRAADLSDGEVLFSTAGQITNTALQRIRKGIGQPGDVLFSHKGTVGKLALVPANAPPFVCSPQTTFWRVTDPGRLNGQFLFAYMRAPEFTRQWTVRKGDTDMADYVSLSAQRTLLVPLPPPTTQRKIAAIVSSYDDLIASNIRRLKILELTAQTIYGEWLVEFRYPGHEGMQRVESEFGPIPSGWKWVALGSLVIEQRRGIDPLAVDPNTPYFGLEHLPQHSIALQEWGKAADAVSRKYQFQTGEILFGKIRPYFHKVGIPPVTGVCSTDAIVLRPSDPEVAGLALAVVSSDAFVQQAVQTSHGTKMPRADWGVLQDYPVAMPDGQLLAQFNDHMMDTSALIHKLIFSNRNLRASRDLLLPRLISGEIDVSSLDIDSPSLIA
jgi:type I restriction enzyme, S subunit